MEITPSKWSWHKCKDELHLYFWGAAIPVFVFIHLVNIFIGPAELAETPEGYVPEYYEYYSHPITRWLAKYVYSDHQANYERAMHHLQQEFEKTQMRRIEAKVNLLQKQRGDYMGNFYIPTDAYKYTQVKVYERENLKEGYGRVD
ncbi:NADH dehydrogenase [ubiquinone] 1 beta subcomplex subunit 5, mitochondrial-like isoform X2 [Varroa jacobsoni]|nr:NADH dehydrogenase [ubiquinone] 1 beta subcomplex subunit 5, mitochondrial-like isoform X2 [Varroa jacobsoni]